MIKEEKNEVIGKDNLSYYEKNKGKIKIQQRVYYQTHKKKLNTRAKDYYKDNREVVLSNNKESERKRDYDKKYYLRNKVRIQQRKKYLYKQNYLRNKMKIEVNS